MAARAVRLALHVGGRRKLHSGGQAGATLADFSPAAASSAARIDGLYSSLTAAILGGSALILAGGLVSGGASLYLIGSMWTVQNQQTVMQEQQTAMKIDMNTKLDRLLQRIDSAPALPEKRK